MNKKLLELANKDIINKHLVELGKIMAKGLSEDELPLAMVDYMDTIPENEQALVNEYFKVDQAIEGDKPELSEISKMILDAGLPPTPEEQDILNKQEQINQDELRKRERLITPRDKEELKECIESDRFFGEIPEGAKMEVENELTGETVNMSKVEYEAYLTKLYSVRKEETRKKRGLL